MSGTDSVLQTIAYYLRLTFGYVLAVLAIVENACRQVMTTLGVPGEAQPIVLLVVAVLFIIAVLRFFGGFLRLILMVFLILLVLRVLLPGTF